jgi:hypothetical protein
VPPGPRMVAPVLANVGMSTQPVKDTHLCALVGVRVLVNQIEHVAYKGERATQLLSGCCTCHEFSCSVIQNVPTIH